MNPLPALKFLPLLCGLLLSVPACAGNEAAALVARGEGRYAQELARYRVAADQGDPYAQQAAGLMLYAGEYLYGEEVRRDLPAARNYLEMAAAQGCQVSKFMLRRLAAHAAGGGARPAPLPASTARMPKE